MKIVILTTYLQEFGIIDALRKEAVNLDTLIKFIRPDYEVVLVSVEDTPLTPLGNNNFLSVALEDLNSLINTLSPDVIHFFEASPYLVHKVLEGRKYAPAKLIVTLVDNDPLFGQEEMLDELLHLSEFNEIFFFCYSDHAFQILMKAGFKNYEVTMPLIVSEFFESSSDSDSDNHKMLHRTTPLDHLTCGFASTPFLPEYFYCRGLGLLCQVLNNTGSDIQLNIPWRSERTAPPKSFIDNQDRVRLTYGYVEMTKFYQDIDVYLLPFAEYGKSHASPHSFWEAIYYEKPVIVTNRVGIAPLVSRYGIGLVIDPDEKKLVEALYYVKDNYEVFLNAIRLFKKDILTKILKQENIVDSYLKVYDNLLIDKSSILTLGAWREACSVNGQKLIKGISELKSYYEEMTEAETYREKRFDTFPMNVFNLMERQVIDLVVSKYHSQSNEPINLLDIAAGEGRISEIIVKYGDLTVIENSPSMLKILLKNLEPNQPNIVEADFLNYEVQEGMNQNYDIITTFRFIRHFEYSHRQKLYNKILQLLKEDGLLIFDIPNKKAEILLRNNLGWGNFNIYDIFWSKSSIQDELNLNGFDLVKLIEVGKYLFQDIFKFDYYMPISWVAVAKKRNIS